MRTWGMYGVVLTLFVSSIALADECGVPYALQDRRTVQRLLAGPLENSHPEGIGGALLRMHELALLCSTGVFSTTKRIALNNEYLAWGQEIDRIGRTGDFARLRPRSLLWTDRVIDPNFLRLTGTTIGGASIDESQRNAQEAARITAEAIHKMWSCF